MTSLPPPEPDGTPATSRNGRGASAPRGRRAARAAVVILTVLEAGGLLGVALWWGVGAVGGAGVRGAEVFLAAFALGVAAVLLAAARRLARGRPGARGPIVTWQVLQAATATAVLGVPAARVFAVAAMVVAAVVVVGILVPGVATVRSGVAPEPPGPA